MGSRRQLVCVQSVTHGGLGRRMYRFTTWRSTTGYLATVLIIRVTAQTERVLTEGPVVVMLVALPAAKLGSAGQAVGVSAEAAGGWAHS